MSIQINKMAPRRCIVVWPSSAVTSFVETMDEAGRPSLGDLLTIASWVGFRRQSWLTASTNSFEPDSSASGFNGLGFAWWEVPPLRKRIEGARRRVAWVRAKDSALLYDEATGQDWNQVSLHAACRWGLAKFRARQILVQTTFQASYLEHAMAIPLAWLTMRSFGHRCVVSLRDIGLERQKISEITFQPMVNIGRVLDSYEPRLGKAA